MTSRKKSSAAAPTPTPEPSTPQTPTMADRSVILAGLMNLGLRGFKAPQLSTNFATSEGGGGAIGRKPGVTKRALIGGL